MKRVRRRRRQEIIHQCFTPWATAWMFLPSDKMPSCKKKKKKKEITDKKHWSRKPVCAFFPQSIISKHNWHQKCSLNFRKKNPNKTHFHLKLIIITVVVGVASCGPALIMKDSRMDEWQKRQFKCITSAKSWKKKLSCFIFVLFYQQNPNEKRNNVQPNLIIKLHTVDPAASSSVHSSQIKSHLIMEIIVNIYIYIYTSIYILSCRVKNVTNTKITTVYSLSADRR